MLSLKSMTGFRFFLKSEAGLKSSLGSKTGLKKGLLEVLKKYSM